jgi:predicted chitinase
VSVRATAWTLADLAAQNGYSSGQLVLTEERLAFIQQRIRHVYRRQRTASTIGKLSIAASRADTTSAATADAANNAATSTGLKVLRHSWIA